MIHYRSLCAATSILIALVPCTGGVVAAAEPLDEHMILVMPDLIMTFDASSVRFQETTRTVRTHFYLSAPDDVGYVSYQSLEEIDCAGKRGRHSETTGSRPNGKVEAVESKGYSPIMKDSPEDVLQEQVCAIEDKPGYPAGGVMLEVPGSVSAHAAFALLKLGLSSKQAAKLASRNYGNEDALIYNLDAQKIENTKRRQVIDALGPLVAEEAKPPPPIVPLEAAVNSGWIGRYVHREMEMGAEIWLKADGTFEYGLTVGSLDEAARGAWSAIGNRIILSAGAMPARRGDVEFRLWQITADAKSLTVVRDGQSMVFGKR